MESRATKSNIVYSLFWKLLERGGTQGIQFVVQIILARLLSPDEYGIIAIVMVFVLLANVFVESGFNTALIQKKEADEIDFSSVLYLSLGVATVLYVIIFFTSPSIASFYKQPLLIPVLRVLSLMLFIGAFNSIQNAYIARNMLFKKLFVSSLGATVFSGVLGIIAAVYGLGVWALVIQQLANQLAVTLILWFTVSWRPKLIFSLKRVKSLFSYGSKLLASNLLDTLYRNIRTLFIGRIYSPSMLGFYNRGDQIPQLIVANINGSIQSVMLPTLAAHQDDKVRIRSMMRRAIVTSSYLLFPMMMGLAVIAEPLVVLLLTDKWLAAVPFIQIACISYSLWPIQTTNLQAINAIGRSDVFLKLEIVKKVVGMIILILSIKYGIYAIALGGVLSGITSMFINAFPSKYLLGYGLKEQLKDILPSLLVSLLVGICIYPVRYSGLNYMLVMGIQILLGVTLYLIFSYVFKLESMIYLFSTMKEVLGKRKLKSGIR